MKPQQTTVILVYGTSQRKKAEELTDKIIIDVTLPDWKRKLIAEIEPEEIENSLVLCINQAYITARKKLPAQVIIRIERLEDIDRDENEESDKIMAARLGDIVISKRVHPAIEQSKAWISPHHLEIIKELFTEGFVIEMLDEQNNLITKFGESK